MCPAEQGRQKITRRERRDGDDGATGDKRARRCGDRERATTGPPTAGRCWSDRDGRTLRYGAAAPRRIDLPPRPAPRPHNVAGRRRHYRRHRYRAGVAAGRRRRRRREVDSGTPVTGSKLFARHARGKHRNRPPPTLRIRTGNSYTRDFRISQAPLCRRP